MYLTPDFSPQSKSYLIQGIFLSLVLHLLAIVFLQHAPLAITPVKYLKLKIITEKPKTKRPKQIVSPPDKLLDKKPKEDTNYLSDNNSFAEKEQIRRGDGPEAGPIPGPLTALQNPLNIKRRKIVPPKINPKSQQKTKQQKRDTARKALDLSPDYRALDALSEEPNKNTDSKTDTDRPDIYAPASQPFSRPVGSGAKFYGMRGSIDFLPHLLDGDITLLNAKADRFAVFVRRVATRVFGNIKQQGWRRLDASHIRSLKDYTALLATLSPTGKLIDIKLAGSSGSQAFDQVLMRAVKNGVSDPHPPMEAAAEDGNFHFIFLARSWVRVTPSGRTRRDRERRWLILKTGLE